MDDRKKRRDLTDKLRKERIKEREQNIELEKFDKRIAGDDTGLTFSDIKKLNSVKKKHLINQMVED